MLQSTTQGRGGRGRLGGRTEALWWVRVSREGSAQVCVDMDVDVDERGALARAGDNSPHTGALSRPSPEPRRFSPTTGCTDSRKCYGHRTRTASVSVICSIRRAATSQQPVLCSEQTRAAQADARWWSTVPQSPAASLGVTNHWVMDMLNTRALHALGGRGHMVCT